MTAHGTAQTESVSRLYHIISTLHVAKHSHSNNEIRNKTDKANWHCDPHFAICRWTCRRIDEGVPLIQDRIFKFVAQRLKWIKFSATKSGCIKDSEVTCYLQHLKLTSSSWIKRKLHHVRFFPGVPSPTFGYLWDSSNASRSIPGRSPAMEGKC